MSSLVKRAARVPPSLLGGEWGGWYCAIDANTGGVKPVPDKFLSETAIEWGQVPVGFEELQSESRMPIPYMDGSVAPLDEADRLSGEGPLRRRRVQIHPSIGCGGDSLPGLVTRSLLAPPRCRPVGGSLLSLLGGAPPMASDTIGIDAWAVDAQVEGRPGVWRLESVLRGHGGPLPKSTVNALPSLGERTRVVVLFDVRTGELAAEPPHPSTPHLKPAPQVEVWQERCWSNEIELQVMEDPRKPLHMDAVDKSKRVGMLCFGEQKSALLPSPSEGAAVGQAPLSWCVRVPGGVEVKGSTSLLQVVLESAESGPVVLTREWGAADVAPSLTAPGALARTRM